MNNTFKLIELGVPIGISLYIGSEFLKLVIEIISNFISWFINKLFRGVKENELKRCKS